MIIPSPFLSIEAQTAELREFTEKENLEGPMRAYGE